MTSGPTGLLDGIRVPDRDAQQEPARVLRPDPVVGRRHLLGGGSPHVDDAGGDRGSFGGREQRLRNLQVAVRGAAQLDRAVAQPVHLRRELRARRAARTPDAVPTQFDSNGVSQSYLPVGR
jgi:hypothetical protein